MSIINEVGTLLGIGLSRSFGLTNQIFKGASGPFSQIFQGYVTISENTVDEIEITQQPVQTGAPITDHAYKKPTTLSIQIIFGSGLFGQSLSTIYNNLLTLQSQFIPFVVTTPKRTYNSMLFKTLSVTTDKSKENIIAINATFQQIIIVPIIAGNISPSQLLNPGSNQATQAVGQKQSALYTGSQIFGGP